MSNGGEPKVFSVTLIEGGKCAEISDNMYPVYLSRAALWLNHHIDADAATKKLGSKRI